MPAIQVTVPTFPPAGSSRRFEPAMAIPIARLAPDEPVGPSALSLKRLWDAMPLVDQRDACTCVWTSDADPYTLAERGRLIKTLARVNQFREKFIERKPVSERASYLMMLMNDHTFPL